MRTTRALASLNVILSISSACILQTCRHGYLRKLAQHHGLSAWPITVTITCAVSIFTTPNTALTNTMDANTSRFETVVAGVYSTITRNTRVLTSTNSDVENAVTVTLPFSVLIMLNT